MSTMSVGLLLVWKGMPRAGIEPGTFRIAMAVALELYGLPLLSRLHIRASTLSVNITMEDMVPDLMINCGRSKSQCESKILNRANCADVVHRLCEIDHVIDTRRAPARKNI